MENDFPIRLIRYLESRFPGCYGAVDGLRVGKSWPGVSEVTELLIQQYRLDLVAAAYYAPALCACSVWNCYKRIYTFQEPLAQTLCGGVDAGSALSFPVDSLQYLSLPGIYVQSPNMICPGIHGFFAWTRQLPQGSSTLELLFLHEDGLGFTPGSIDLVPGTSLSESLPESEKVLYPLLMAAAHGEEGALRLMLQKLPVHTPYPNVIHNLTVRAAQLLFYLVSANADITMDADISKPVAVGKAISKNLQQASARKSHVRQGHWHKYWYGPKNGERRLLPKWIPPVIVGESRELSVKLTTHNLK